MASSRDNELAELKSANAALTEALAARTAELVRYKSDYQETLEQQTATAEILQIIDRSAGDLAPVFDAILERAMRLGEAAFGSLFTYDGERFQLEVQRSVPAAYAEFRANNPPVPQPGGTFARALETRRSLQDIDLMALDAYRANPNTRAMVELGGVRTILTVPLCKDETVLGLITVYRQEVRAFSERQIALVEGFAAQAVIAMENARLITETREALEQQTATAEVLQVINSSPGDLAPVFDAILEKAIRLCGGNRGGLWTFDGERGRLAASSGLSADFVALLRERGEGGTYQALQRVMRGEHLFQFNVPEHELYRSGDRLARVAFAAGVRTLIWVALVKDGVAIGAFAIGRSEVRQFSHREIALLQNFAAQAVIAMENARLITDTREALQQQTATAEVLRVINASPGDLRPVFDTVLEKAMRLCDAAFGEFHIFDGERVLPAALLGLPQAYAEFRLRTPPVYQAGTLAWRIREGADVLHIADLMDEDVYRNGDPQRRAMVDLGGARSAVSVALRKDDTLLGIINIYRQEVKPFGDRQIALLQSFAAQAVIAMENARLLTELRQRTEELAQRNSEYGERIEQQAATIDVLKVMSASPGDAQPVFKLIVERAQTFCEADGATLALLESDMLHLQAYSGFLSGDFEAVFPRPVSRETMFGRAILSRDVVQMPDASVDPDHYTQKRTKRAIIAVPLLRAGAPIGAIAIGRRRTGEFSVAEVELLRTFAEQAVIAISSAETYRELQERTAALTLRNSEYGERIEHQSATIDVLKVMSASPGDAQPVFDLITRRAQEVCNAPAVMLFEYDGELMHFRSQYGSESGAAPGSLEAYKRLFPMVPTRALISCRAVLDRQIVEVRDMTKEPHLLDVARDLGHRSNLAVPLLRDGVAIGVIGIISWEPGGFSESQVALMKTFAEQAVIAITSAETYCELQERTAALALRNSEYGERIEQQAATIDVLKVMSASPDDTQPVFDQIVQRAQELCNAWAATLCEFDGTLVHRRAYTSNLAGAEMAAYRAYFPMAPVRGSITCRAILDKQIIHVRDMDAETTIPAVRRLPHKSQLSIPLLRDNEAIGAITLGALEPGGFSDSQVALLQTFAEQAVIAITSVANFRALRERTAELTRSVAELQALEEVLRAVNSSLELETVLSTIIGRAVQLSDADEGTIYEFDDDAQVFVPKSAYGMSDERVAILRDRRIRIGETPLGNSAAMRAPLHISDLSQTPDLDGSRTLVEAGIHALLAVPLLRDDTVLGGLVIRRRAVGGFAPTVPTLLQTFAGQCVLAIENARLFQEARRARVQAETTLADLRRTQDRLVQSEKMASLGQLTAGIAHEIKNPLNFVNNFSELSVDLLDELHEVVAQGKLTVADDIRREIDELTATLKGNLEKIAEHGRRADSIVKNMLLHSRSGPGEHRMVDLNATAQEALNLAYHGARAATPGFNITIETRLDPRAGKVDMYPQEITRVLLNLIGNGFYAAHERAETTDGSNFEPTLRLTTRDLGEAVEIRVRDNGMGISEAVRDRIFEPFFTTKPAGEGTGLGLSLSYDIVVQQHGGRLTVDSDPGAFTEFVVTLPRTVAAARVPA